MKQTLEEDARIIKALSRLFGADVVEQARRIDIADLNLNEEMTRCIASGINRLKDLKADPAAQTDLVKGMEPGARLLLCMWIMDMELLDRIQKRP